MSTHSAVQLCCCFPRLCERGPPMHPACGKRWSPTALHKSRVASNCCERPENDTVAPGALRGCVCVGQTLRFTLLSQTKLIWLPATVCKQGDEEQHTLHPSTHSSICPDTSHPSCSVNEHHVVIYRRPWCRIWYISRRGGHAQTNTYTHSHIHTYTRGLIIPKSFDVY